MVLRTVFVGSHNWLMKHRTSTCHLSIYKLYRAEPDPVIYGSTVKDSKTIWPMKFCLVLDSFVLSKWRLKLCLAMENFCRTFMEVSLLGKKGQGILTVTVNRGNKSALYYLCRNKFVWRLSKWKRRTWWQSLTRKRRLHQRLNHTKWQSMKTWFLSSRRFWSGIIDVKVLFVGEIQILNNVSDCGRRFENLSRCKVTPFVPDFSIVVLSL